MDNELRFGTRAVHAGVEPDPTTGAIMTPIYQTSTYVQAAPGDHKGYEYARTQNPTRRVLEQNLAALENGADGICFGSGLDFAQAIIEKRPLVSVDAVFDEYGVTRLWN